VNVDSEISKANKRLIKIDGSISNVQKQVATKDYKSKVPLAVQEQNDAKLTSLHTEAEAVRMLITNFEELEA